MRRFYDISMPIYQGMLSWPSDPDVFITPFKEIAAGKSSNVSAITMGTHSGTHLDPPVHFFPDGATVDTLSFDAMIGEATVVALEVEKEIGRDVLEELELNGVERILFKTKNSLFIRSETFKKDFVHLTKDGAQYLADIGVKLVGIDYLSIDGYGDKEAPVHNIFLSRGIVILESIDLSAVEPGRYQLICLPLRIVKGNGGPARVVLIKGSDLQS
ncbi:MAG TPA: cyclase family protein [Actinobacteria bacterium]|nr:cyclase family protein [Actinomycetes bacterium]HEX21527.1 cyclase family protein [Actinomycetota bacterium]